MYLAINGQEIAAYPSSFQVTVLDLDNAETTARTADGTLARDRISVKRQIEINWPPLKSEPLSALLQSIGDTFFNLEYPDPVSGQQETRTFYAGNRVTPVAITRNGITWWSGLQVTLTEQ